MKRHWWVLSLAVVNTAAFAPMPVAGQGGRIWLEPRAGWVVPTRDLGRTDVLDNSGFGVFERAEHAATFGLGAAVEVTSRVALRLSVDRSLAGVRGEWRCAPFVACPSVLLPVDGELTRWTTSLDAIYRPVTPLPLDPVLFAGFGVRRNQLDWSEPAADITLPAFSFDETEAVFRVGAGLERSLGRARVFGEVEASSARFGGAPYESIEGSLVAERTRSLDMGFVGGLRFRLR